MPRLLQTLRLWFDSDPAALPFTDDDRRIDPLRILPFLLLHVAALAAPFLVLPSWPASLLALGLFFLRMFAITAVYHRYLGHRSYTAPRWLVFIGALVANSSAQRGPLWWAAHHRAHHRHSDQPGDLHRPSDGFWSSHCFWFLTRGAFRSRRELLPDLADRWELRLLDRFDWLAPLLLAAACWGFGTYLASAHPSLGASGSDCLLWGFVVSTVVTFHATFTINSLAHRWGSRPYATGDDSRNNVLLALLTLGEGWHNNHHRYPGAARQGFAWYELDITWLILRLFAACGLISDLRGVPERVLAERHRPPAEDPER